MIKARDRQVIRNMASGMGVMVVNMGVFFFLTPYMRVQLGEKLVGLWYLIATLTGYMGLVQTGATVALTKYVAETRARGDKAELEAVVNTGMMLYLLLMGAGLVAAVVVYAVAGWMPAIAASGRQPEVMRALVLVLATFVFNLPFVAIRATINGFQRFDFNNASRLVKTLLSAGGIYVILRQGGGLTAMAGWNLAVSVGLNAVAWVFMGRLMRVRWSRRLARRDLMGKLFNFGALSFISSIAHLLFYYTDNTVIGIMIPAAGAIFVYGTGFKLFDFIQQLCGGAINVLMPVASEITVLEEGQRRRKVAELFTRGTRFSTMLILPPVLFLLMFGEQFVTQWQSVFKGEAYAFGRETYLVFVILGVPLLGAINLQIGAQILIGLGRLRFLVGLHVLTALLNLGLSLGLARVWGIFGVAVGTAVPLVVFEVVFNGYMRRVFGISLRRYYGEVWRRLWLLTAGLAVVLGVERLVWGQAGLGVLIGIAAADGAVFWGLCYWGLDAYERKVVRHLVGRGEEEAVVSDGQEVGGGDGRSGGRRG